VTTTTEKHIICNHCSHPTHVEHIGTNSTHGACSVCGCSKEQHGSGSTPGVIGGGTSGNGTAGGAGTGNGGGNDGGGSNDGKSSRGGEKTDDGKSSGGGEKTDDSEEGEDPDSWGDEGEVEKPEPEEDEADDPFEEAEEPISENSQKPENTEKPQNNNGGKGGIGKSYKLRRVFFDHDKWDIKPESVDELNKLKSYLSKNPDLCIRLDAHTDSNGSNEYNKELSRKRAQSVVDYLIGNGIDPVRLSAQGFGEEFPVTTNDTAEGREENRRVEFTKMGC
jgi:outer membrane protein OmpA-like peptidoglycan-associated protein